MTKKQLQTRLESLLADLEQDAISPPKSGYPPLDGWRWECDAEGRYLYCTSEVKGVLGIDPQEFVGKELKSFSIVPSCIETIEAALNAGVYPLSMNVYYQDRRGNIIPVILHALSRPDDNDHIGGLHGFVQVVQMQIPQGEIKQQTPDNEHEKPSCSPDRVDIPGFDKSLKSTPPGTISEEVEARVQIESLPVPKAGLESVEGESIAPARGNTDSPAALAVPLRLSGQTEGLLEILDDQPGRIWSEDEYRLVEQVADQLTLALENAQLFQSEQRRANELNTLVELSRMISENLDLEEIYQTAHRIISQLMLTETFSINLLNETKKEFSTAYMIDKNVRLPVEQFPASAGFSGYVCQTRKPYIVYDLEIEETPFQRIYTAGSEVHVRSVIAVPLLFSGEAIGAMTVQCYQPNTYNRLDLRLLETYADHIAIAIQNARLFEQSQITLEETETLYQASAEINTAQSYQDILEVLRRHTLAGRESCRVNLVFFDKPWTNSQSPEWAEVLSTWPAEAQQQEENRYQVGKYPAPLKLLQSENPLLIENIEDNSHLDDALSHTYIHDFEARSALFINIVVTGQWLGFISAFYRQPIDFQDVEIRRLTALVNQAGVALQNLRNIEVAEQRAQEAQDRSEELALINRVVTSVVSSPDLNQVLETMAGELAEVLSVNQVDISLLNENRNALIQTAVSSPISGGISGRGDQIPINTYPVMLEVMAHKKLVVVEGAASSPLTAPLHDILKQRQVQSMLVAPILSAGEVVGIVSLQVSGKQHNFSSEQIRLTETLVAQLSTAIQNAHLFDQIQNALAETETLYQASAELNGVQNYDDILSILRKYTVLGSKDTINISVNLFDRPWIKDDIPDSYRPIARWASSPYAEIPYTRYPMRSWAMIKQVLKPDYPTLISDTLSDSRIDSATQTLFVERLEAKSLVYAPLNAGGSWIGHISAAFSQTVSLKEQDFRRLMALASQAGVAIQNIRLLEESRRRAAQLETAAEIARDTSGTLALDTLLKRAVTLIRDRYGYYHASIFLLDETGSTAVIRESTGEAGEEMKRQGHRLAVGSRSIIGYVTELGKPLVINDVIQDPIHRPNPLLPETRAELGVPLKIGNRVIGAMDVQSTEANIFTPDDISVIQTLADQIAVAVDNARSYEIAQQAIKETRQRVQELSMLFNVSQGLASASMETIEIANIISHRLVEIMGTEHCSILLLDDDEEHLNIVVNLTPSKNGDGMDKGRSTARSERKISTEQYPGIGHVKETQLPYIVKADGTNGDLQLMEYMGARGFATQILVPITTKGRLAGVIELATADPDYTYTSDQLNLSVTITNAAAVALENARLYEDQRQLTEKLREVDKLKSQFLANMSHELRTPLNSIIGFSRVILKGIDGPINEIQQQDLTAIHNSGSHLLRLINNVLDISKIEAGKMDLSFEKDVNIIDLINSVMSTTIALVKDKPVRLEKVIQPDLPNVRADPTRINQVMLNLMSNAAKFTEEGSITIEAGVETGPEDRPALVVRVTDTGVGISPEDQKKLFMPFSQVDESPTRKTGGSGLGLSISRLLVEMHGGRIGVNSQVGKGSTFWFTIPVPEPEIFQVPEGDKAIVLAIDDDQQVLNLYDRYLNEHGFQVIPLTDPFKAVERASTLKPFAIILDVLMPGLNGWQVLDNLRSTPETKKIPVIICSLLEDLGKGFSLGAAHYLTKPVLEEDLVDALTKLNSDGSIQDILVIDDDPDDLRLMEKILNNRYTVRLALGGLEGLAALRQQRPSAVILDLFMPNIDGFTVLENMHEDPGLKDLPVIIFTAGDLTEQHQEQLANFSLEMMHKSGFSEQEMLATIQRALQRYSLPDRRQ
jgi:GAF domain-containing protein/CheY-like chemotaxis protein